jgi:predicted NBD/HSP70 family sugar kinase
MTVTGAATRPDTLRRHNLSVALFHIHQDGALTRAELTSRMGVSRSTVGALVADLTALGLVEEMVPSGGAGVGRPSHVVVPHSRGPYVATVDIDVTHLVVAAVGIGGDVLAREVVDTGSRLSTPGGVASVVADKVSRLGDATGRGRPPLAIGVSVPGTVDRYTGRVAVAPNLDWHDESFGRELAQLLPEGMRVEVGNDADLAVLAEHTRGSARGCDDVVYLIGRVGVGAGIIINGMPLRGHDGHAGEIGHNVFDLSGPLCHCGKHGCVETYIGEGALLSQAGRRLPPTGTAVGAVFAGARGGDAVALAAVRAVAEPLGRTIAGLVNTLNPQRVLLGGSFSAVLEIARPQIEDALYRFTLEAPGRTVELIQPALGADSSLLGAAEVAFAQLLGDPLVALSH